MSRKSKCLCLLLGLLFFAGGCSSSTQLPEKYQSDLKDGTYLVSSEYYDPFGYGLVFEMSVVDGIVTEVSYRQYDRSGKERLSSGKDIRWTGCEMDLDQILQKSYNSMIQNQNQKIDTVTGATQTCEDFMVLAAQALTNAQKGIPRSKTADFNWTYTAENEKDPLTGSQEIMTVSFRGSTLTEIVCEETVNTTALYPTGRVYAQLAGQSESEKSLADRVYEDDPEIAFRYNALLADIREQRSLFHYSKIES